MLRNRLTTDTKVLYPNSKYNKKYRSTLAHKISFDFSVDTLTSTETLICIFFANENIKKAGYISWSLLQRQKRIVIYYIKKFIKESP